MLIRIKLNVNAPWIVFLIRHFNSGTCISSTDSSYFALPSWNMKPLTKGVFLKSFSENIQQIYKGAPMPKWNYASAWVFTFKFAVYFQNTFKNTTRGMLLFYVIWGTIVSCFHFSTLDFFNVWTSKSSYYYAISLTTLLNSSTYKCTIFQMRLFAINHYYNVFFLSF